MSRKARCSAFGSHCTNVALDFCIRIRLNNFDMEKPLLLIVDDEKPTREGLRAALEDHYDVYIADDAATAMALLEQENFEVLLTDFRLPQEDGMKLIARAKSLSKPPICILMTAYGSEELAVDAMKRGADDYIAKGRLQIDELEMRIARALRQQNLEVENVSLRRQLQTKFGVENIIGESPAMNEVLDVVRQVAPTRASVLILGESGTGKELIAKAIHQLSPRARQPLVSVHCAALAPTLLESELFGHERGAFTGAHERRVGRFEQAQGGTLFLDEIGEIDQTLQVKLLRFLGERTFERVGSNKTISADVRLIAATNKSLEELVKVGKFREDLFFRLRVVEIVMPPLRERTTDIPLLVQSFLREFSKENDKQVTTIVPDAVEALMTYSWPGNVRELRTAIEHAVVLARGNEITFRDLPPSIRGGTPSILSPSVGVSQNNLSVKEAEKQLIIRALKECDGNRSLAAQKTGMSRRTLHRKLHEYHLEGF
jgi:DNA-binding NtrC family response regulator